MIKTSVGKIIFSCTKTIRQTINTSALGDNYTITQHKYIQYSHGVHYNQRLIKTKCFSYKYFSQNNQIMKSKVGKILIVFCIPRGIKLVYNIPFISFSQTSWPLENLASVL